MGVSIAVINFNDRNCGIQKFSKTLTWRLVFFTKMFYVKKYELRIKNKLKNK